MFQKTASRNFESKILAGTNSLQCFNESVATKGTPITLSWPFGDRKSVV